MIQSFLLKNLSEITTTNSPREINPHSPVSALLNQKISILFPNHTGYLTPMSATCKKIIGLKLYTCIILTLGLIFFSQDFRLSYDLYKNSQKITLLPQAYEPVLDDTNPDRTLYTSPTGSSNLQEPSSSSSTKNTYPNLRIGLFSPSDKSSLDSTSPDQRLRVSPILPTGSNILAAQASSPYPVLPPSPTDSSHLTGRSTDFSKELTPHDEPTVLDPDLAEISRNLGSIFASTRPSPSQPVESSSKGIGSMIHTFEPMNLSDPLNHEVLHIVAKLRPTASKDVQFAWARSIPILRKILADFELATLETMLNFWTTGSMASIIKKDKSVSSGSSAHQLSSSDVDSLVNKNKSSLTDQNLAHIGLYFSTSDKNSPLPGDVLVQYFYTLYVPIIQLGAMSHDELKEYLAFEQAFAKCSNFEYLKDPDPDTQHNNEYDNTKQLGQAAYDWLWKIKQTDYHCGSVLKAVLNIAILIKNQKNSAGDSEDLFESMIQFLELYQKPS